MTVIYLFPDKPRGFDFITCNIGHTKICDYYFFHLLQAFSQNVYLNIFKYKKNPSRGLGIRIFKSVS